MSEALKIEPASWQVLPDMPIEKWEAATIVIDGKIYILGGYGAGFGGVVERFRRAGDHRYRRGNRRLARSCFVAHEGDAFGCRADENEPGVLAPAGEFRIL